MSSVVSSEWHLELSNHLVYSTNYGCIYLYVGSIILLLQCLNFRSRSFISIHCKYGTRASFRSFRIIQLILSDVGRANGFFAIVYAVSREACIRMRTTRSFGKAVKVENVKLAATRAIARSFVNTVYTTNVLRVRVYIRIYLASALEYQAVSVPLL